MNDINIQEILKILPHRYPFLLIDKILSLDPAPDAKDYMGRKIHAIKNVTFNENFFPGHFPGKPVMPGVLIIEAMAQASAFLAYRPPAPGVRLDVYIIAVDGARFRQPVVPGDCLNLHCEVVRDRGAILAFRCEAKVDGKLVAEADLLAKQFPATHDANA